MAAKEMKIEGMTCLHCEKTVAEALAGAGASKVEANWREGRAVFDAGTAGDRDLRVAVAEAGYKVCLLYTSPSPRDLSTSRMPSSA